MRSLLRLIGLDASADADSRDTQTVRRIAGELDRLPEAEARYLAAFAYVLARVAHADFEISEAELREMERLVQACGDLSQAQAALVVQIAKTQTVTLGATENYLVTRQFRELSSKEQRLALLRCLFAVAAADDSISEVENANISQIAGELGLTSSETAAARSAYRDKLAVLKELPT
jgi:uncharacterized tellurite resistance protein B-like protein